MAQAGHWVGHAFDKMVNKEINFLSDAQNLLLVGSGWTPIQARDAYVSDIRSNEVSGTGYSANGLALASKTVTYVDAAVPALTRANGTVQTLGQIVQGDAGLGVGQIYKCTTAGTNGGSSPSPWNAVLGGTTTDGTTVWTNVGSIAPARAVQAYVLNDIIRDAAGHLFRCVVAGTVSGAAPTYLFSYIGQQTSDTGGVIWEWVGFGQTILSAATVTWAASTISANYAVLADFATGADATRPLVMYVDFGGALASTNGAFSIQWDSHGIMPIYLS